MVCWCIRAGWKGRLPEKVTQSHPHPAAKETGVQRGRDLPKDTQQSQGWTAQSRLLAWVLPATRWGPASKRIPGNARPLGKVSVDSVAAATVY